MVNFTGPLLIQNPGSVGRPRFPLFLAKASHGVEEKDRNHNNPPNNRAGTGIFPDHQPHPKWSQNRFEQAKHRCFGSRKISWSYGDQRNSQWQQNGSAENQRAPLHRIHLRKLCKKGTDGSRYQQPQYYGWNHIELPTTPHNRKTQAENRRIGQGEEIADPLTTLKATARNNDEATGDADNRNLGGPRDRLAEENS